MVPLGMSVAVASTVPEPPAEPLWAWARVARAMAAMANFILTCGLLLCVFLLFERVIVSRYNTASKSSEWIVSLPGECMENRREG
jgi:uncharacterized iron-regulated membrane protein